MQALTWRGAGTYAFASVLLVAACDRCDKQQPSTPEKTPAADVKAVSKVAPQEVLPTKRVVVDLLKRFDLVERDRGGPWIDFGSADYRKYVQGGFRTGVGRARVLGEVRGRDLSVSARFFMLAKKSEAARELELWIRPHGARSALLFVNGKEAGSVSFADRHALGLYGIPVAPHLIQEGENYFLLRVLGAATSPAATLVRARLRPAGDAPTGARRLNALAGPQSVDGRVELLPGDRIAVTLPAHERALLGLKAKAQSDSASAKLEVRSWSLDADPAPAFQTLSVAPKEQEYVFSLDHAPGELVRLELGVPVDGAGLELSTFGLFAEVEAAPQVPPKAKRVVLLLIDTLRAERLRPFNAKSRVETPAMSALAAEAVLFERALSPENWTKPATASVLTGLFPITHQTKTDAARLPDKAEMISEAFKAAGFRTASLIANGYVSDKFGFDQGWDKYLNYIRSGRRTQAENVFRDGLAWIDSLTPKAVEGEAKAETPPFFLYLHTIDPHVPYDPPKKWLEHYDKAPYAGVVAPRLTPQQLADAKRSPPRIKLDERDKARLMALHDGEISYHDEHLAAFVEGLKSRGLFEDTLIVVTSDHGEEFNEHASWGHGHSLYNELLNVPFLVHFPKAFKARRVEEAISTVHIAPTLLELAGVPPLKAAEGRSLVPLLGGASQKLDDRVAVSDFLDDRKAIQTRRWKLELRGFSTSLYDLRADPWEQQPLGKGTAAYVRFGLRALLGHFVASDARRDWLGSGADVPESADEAPGGDALKREETDIDEATREQLKALGYGA